MNFKYLADSLNFSPDAVRLDAMVDTLILVL
jgi:hypothetical protein